MSRQCGLLSICVVAWFLALAGPPAAESEGRRWALVVGINDYQHVGGLRFCRQDAQAVGAVLVEQAGFPARRVIVLTDGTDELKNTPTIGTMRSRIRQITTFPAEGDTVLIYFSGHGVTLEGQDYLMPVDAERHARSAISLDWVKARLEKCRADTKLLVLDMCRPGSEKSVGSVSLDLKARSGVSILTSCASGQTSHEHAGHGVFSRFLVEGLGGAADSNEDNAVTQSELYAYVTDKVTDWCVNSGKTQTPKLLHAEDSDAIVARLAAESGADTTDPVVAPGNLRATPGKRQKDGAAEGLASLNWMSNIPPPVVPDRHATIQEAIDAAEDGDIVVVAPGTYREWGINFRGKEIALTSTNPGDQSVVKNTEVDAAGKGSVLVFESGEGRDAVLCGLTISNGRSREGGGIRCTNGSSPTIVRNLIIRNIATHYDTGGGGILVRGGAPAIISNMLLRNRTEGQYCDGAAILLGRSHATVSGNIIQNNWTEGRYSQGSVAISGGDILMSNNVIAQNRSESSGTGGIHCGGATLKLFHNTITGNSGVGGGGAIFIGGAGRPSNVTVLNSILWKNGSRHAVYSKRTAHKVAVSYSNISGGRDALGGRATITWGKGNIEADPQFRSPRTGDYRLRSDSPCVNAGRATGHSLPATDIQGRQRKAYGAPDLGAYEYVGEQHAGAPATTENRSFSPGERQTVKVSDAERRKEESGDPEGMLERGLSPDKIRKVLGEPDSKMAGGTGNKRLTIWIYPKVKLWIANDELVKWRRKRPRPLSEEEQKQGQGQRQRVKTLELHVKVYALYVEMAIGKPKEGSGTRIWWVGEKNEVGMVRDGKRRFPFSINGKRGEITWERRAHHDHSEFVSTSHKVSSFPMPQPFELDEVSVKVKKIRGGNISVIRQKSQGVFTNLVVRIRNEDFPWAEFVVIVTLRDQ